MRGPGHHRVPVTTTALTGDQLAVEVRAALPEVYVSRSDARRLLATLLTAVADDLAVSGLPGGDACARRVLALVQEGRR